MKCWFRLLLNKILILVYILLLAGLYYFIDIPSMIGFGLQVRYLEGIERGIVLLLFCAILLSGVFSVCFFWWGCFRNYRFYIGYITYWVFSSIFINYFWMLLAGLSNNVFMALIGAPVVFVVIAIPATIQFLVSLREGQHKKNSMSECIQWQQNKKIILICFMMLIGFSIGLSCFDVTPMQRLDGVCLEGKERGAVLIVYHVLWLSGLASVFFLFKGCFRIYGFYVIYITYWAFASVAMNYFWDLLRNFHNNIFFAVLQAPILFLSVAIPATIQYIKSVGTLSKR